MIRRMRGTRRVAARPVLLAAAAAFGVLGGHVLDAYGLLPGVHESAAVRSAVLAPTYDVATVLGAAVLGFGVERLLRCRRRALALLALVGGQLGLLALPEVIGREEAGGGEEWGALSIAVLLQVLVAAGAVGLAVLVESVLVRALRPPRRPALPAVPRLLPAATSPRLGRRPRGVRTRGPPLPVDL
jgi:hypothetical protein